MYFTFVSVTSVPSPSSPQKVNEQAAAMFESGEEPEVTTGIGIMNDLVVPCIPLLLIHDAERDLLAVEDMRNRWCSYLGQEMERERKKDFLFISVDLRS